MKIKRRKDFESMTSLNSKRRLFLVCPTDQLELLILQKINGKAFFYSALGAYLEYSIDTQYELWDLIHENRIEEVLFITTVANEFYKKAIEQQYIYPADEILSTMKDMAKYQASSRVFLPNFYLFAARYMAVQKKRLLLTFYLGDHLLRAGIPVKGYVYHYEKDVFYNLEELEFTGNLLKDISCN